MLHLDDRYLRLRISWIRVKNKKIMEKLSFFGKLDICWSHKNMISKTIEQEHSLPNGGL